MAKGSQFERDMAKTLTEWVTGKKKPYIFWRTPSSGQLMTVSEAWDVSGDLMAIRPEGIFLTNKFNFECKNGYPKADFHKHLKKLKKPDEIYEFWSECIRDARKAGKHGSLIWRKKNHPIIIGFELEDTKYFRDHLKLPENTLVLRYGGILPSIEFFNFKDFFSLIPASVFKKVIEGLVSTKFISFEGQL